MDPVIVSVNLSGDLGQKIRAAAAAGFAGIEIYDTDFMEYGRPAAEVRRLLADHGLRLVAYQPLREFEARPEPHRAEAFDRAERTLDLAAALGAELLLICASIAPDTLNGDARAAADLAELGDRARARGLRLAYEPMAWSRRVRDYAHGWEVVRVSGHPNVGLCIDTFHTFMRADPLDTLPAIPAEKLFLVQANDALRIDLDVIEISRHHRALPGRGYFRLPEFMRALGRTSYDGPLSLEIFSDVLRALPPGQSAAECMRGYRWLRGLLPAR